MGVMSFGTAKGSKQGDPHLPSSSSRPVWKIKSYATWNSKAYLENIQVSNFKSATTVCGAKQSAFAINSS
jgi:hypothetical protein